ncbi:hypothetical protein MBANPS3_012040 [Mucor bainieri]
MAGQSERNGCRVKNEPNTVAASTGVNMTSNSEEEEPPMLDTHEPDVLVKIKIEPTAPVRAFANFTNDSKDDDLVEYIHKPDVTVKVDLNTVAASVAGPAGSVVERILVNFVSDSDQDALMHDTPELDYNDYDTDAAYDSMSTLVGPDFEHIAFEQCIREHGHNFDCAKAAVKTKSMANNVRYFYQWKKTDRYQPVYSE